MQKPFGRGGRSRSVRQTALETRGGLLKPAPTQHQTNFNLTTDFRNTGKPRSRTKTAKNTTRRKSSEGVRFGKTCCARYYGVRRLPDTSFFVLCSLSSSFSGAGEGIRTPDPLITNQMLYRLSYASTGERRVSAQAYPSDPFQMSGTII